MAAQQNRAFGADLLNLRRIMLGEQRFVLLARPLLHPERPHREEWTVGIERGAEIGKAGLGRRTKK